MLPLDQLNDFLEKSTALRAPRPGSALDATLPGPAPSVLRRILEGINRELARASIPVELGKLEMSSPTSYPFERGKRADEEGDLLREATMLRTPEITSEQFEKALELANEWEEIADAATGEVGRGVLRDLRGASVAAPPGLRGVSVAAPAAPPGLLELLREIAKALDRLAQQAIGGRAPEAAKGLQRRVKPQQVATARPRPNETVIQKKAVDPFRGPSPRAEIDVGAIPSTGTYEAPLVELVEPGPESSPLWTGIRIALYVLGIVTAPVGLVKYLAEKVTTSRAERERAERDKALAIAEQDRLTDEFRAEAYERYDQTLADFRRGDSPRDANVARILRLALVRKGRKQDGSPNIDFEEFFQRLTDGDNPVLALAKWIQRKRKPHEEISPYDAASPEDQARARHYFELLEADERWILAYRYHNFPGLSQRAQTLFSENPSISFDAFYEAYWRGWSRQKDAEMQADADRLKVELEATAKAASQRKGAESFAAFLQVMKDLAAVPGRIGEGFEGKRGRIESKKQSAKAAKAKPSPPVTREPSPAVKREPSPSPSADPESTSPSTSEESDDPLADLKKLGDSMPDLQPEPDLGIRL